MAEADALVVASGREGTLPAVIGLPVSTGYGIGGGQAALYSMLQSCSVLTVVNIDAGFVAEGLCREDRQAKSDKSEIMG